MSSLIAGKGRTGLAIICTLLMQGYFNDMKGLSTIDVVNSAINFFREKRGDGIENPDQIRFIYQFLQSSDSMGADILLQSSLSLQPSVYVSDLVLYNVPVGESGIIVPHLAIFLKHHSSRSIVFNTLWTSADHQVVSSLQPHLVIPVASSALSHADPHRLHRRPSLRALRRERGALPLLRQHAAAAAGLRRQSFLPLPELHLRLLRERLPRPLHALLRRAADHLLAPPPVVLALASDA